MTTLQCDRRAQGPRIAAAALLAAFLVAPALATWSIIIVDTRTREMAVGSATCVTNIDLRRYLPVVRPDIGIGCAQSFIDQSGVNRRLIWDELGRGTDPLEILTRLAAQDSQHQTRQYGIVDALGRAATFTGTSCGAFANGITGQIGDLAYSIQGNVITCQTVLDAARDAIADTPGGVPEKLMAAMEAARDWGGDGRCSCRQSDPTGCGCPPGSFTRTANVGFMIDARRGDPAGGCSSGGCAVGAYFMVLNVPNNSNPDPVPVLRSQFDSFRASRVGRADQIVSRATLAAPALAADGQSATQMTIELLDWRGEPAANITSVTVAHDTVRGSAGSCTIGAVESLGGHLYRVGLTAGATAGVDHFLVNVSQFGQTRPLMPSPTLILADRGDLNGDSRVNNFDIDPFVLALIDPPAYALQYPSLNAAFLGDVNEDGTFNNGDVDAFAALLTR